MTIDVAGMRDALVDAMEAAFGTPEDETKLEEAMEAMATGIVDYIKANAVVTGDVVVASGSSAGTYPIVSGKVT